MTRDQFYSAPEAARRLLDRDDATVRHADVDGMICFPNPLADARTVAEFRREHPNAWVHLLDLEIGLDADAAEELFRLADSGDEDDPPADARPTRAETLVPAAACLVIAACAVAFALYLNSVTKGM